MTSTRAAGRDRIIAPAPFLKWAGGKRQLLAQFASLYPTQVARFVEVFTGSGAVFFDVRRRFPAAECVLLDNNEELVNCYRAVRDDAGRLVARLEEHERRHGREHYYRVRAISPVLLDETSRAARLIYLNRTCYNGLYRVNSRGEFNVPMGAYARPRIANGPLLRAAAQGLQGAQIEVADFRDAPSYARSGDFVYLDPPYEPLSPTSSFTAYSRGAFTSDDQRTLADVYRALDRVGCLVMLSNSAAPLIRELYTDYRIDEVLARRAINSVAMKRGAIAELVVRNY